MEAHFRLDTLCVFWAHHFLCFFGTLFFYLKHGIHFSLVGGKMASKERKKSKQPKEFVEDYDKNRQIVEAISARPENNACFDCNAHGMILLL